MAQRFVALCVTILLIFVVNADALGINCRGSSECSGRGGAMVRLRDAIIADNDPSRQYNSGQQIACTDTNICAFVQNFDIEQVPQSKIGTLMAELVDHNCGTCGSVPLDYPSSNDIENGELTANYVTNPCIRKSGSYVCF